MDKGFKWITGLLLLLTLAGAPIYAAKSPIIITIKNQVTVDEGPVSLADIAASIEGAATDEERLLEAVNLGKAPAAGRSRSMARQYVSFKLAQAGFKGEDILLEMEDHVQVTGAGVQLTTEMLKKMIEDAITTSVPKLWNSWQLTLSGNFSNRWVPPGKLAAVVEDGPDEIEPGTNLLQVNVMSDGKPALHLAVAVRVDAVGKVPVLQTDLAKHSQLPASAIQWEERPLTGREILTLSEDCRTTRRLKKGEPLNQTDVETDPLVHKGEKIRIVYQSGGASVMVFGIAQTDGWLGQTINVENIDSKKVLTGLVVAEGSVEVK